MLVVSEACCVVSSYDSRQQSHEAASVKSAGLSYSVETVTFVEDHLWNVALRAPSFNDNNQNKLTFEVQKFSFQFSARKFLASSSLFLPSVYSFCDMSLVFYTCQKQNAPFRWITCIFRIQHNSSVLA